jgi:hypothetical protein
MSIVMRRESMLEEKKSYFCSELVAALYKAMDLLPAAPPANQYVGGWVGG